MNTEIADIESTALSAPGLAERIGTIQTPEQYAKAGEFLVWIKDLMKAVDALCDPKIAEKHKAHKEELAKKARLADPLARAEEILDAPMRAYLAEEKRQREEATRIAEAAARKAEEDARIVDAIFAELAGDPAEAEAILAAPAVVPPVVIPKAVPKVEGLATTTEWHWKITDEKKIPRLFYDLAEARINAVVRTNKKLAEQMIPGIEVWSEEKIRGARKP